MRDWISFWDSKHSIYVNAHHHAAHYRRIADDLARYVPPGGVVLDYGCGEALSADRMAAKAARLVLCEAAPGVRQAIAARFAGQAAIEACAPQELEAWPDASFDFIIMHSVAQYLTSDELDRLLVLFRRLLKAGGLLLVGDIIPRRVSAFTDVVALLRFAAREGFFWAALGGLIRTAFSRYSRLRSTLGLARYDASEMIGRLSSKGFLAKRANANVGHNPARMTFLAWPA